MASKAEFNVSFDIYNEKAVRKLQEEDPDLLPDYAVNSEKDLAYNKQQVNSAIESAILNGKSVDKIAEDLQDRMENVNERSAIKMARTAVTSAQNNGTLDSFYEARDMGINIQKEWEATLDDRTRPSHRELDGERRDLDERFSNGLMYPGDPDGNPDEIYWCRCTLVSYMPDVEVKEGGDRITYKEWLENPRVVNDETASDINNFIENWNNNDSDGGKNDVIEAMPVKRLIVDESEDERISALAGKDATEGSCASLCLAYCGREAGYDVYDCRGGRSRDTFADGYVWKNICDKAGISYKRIVTNTPYQSAMELIDSEVAIGKEYILMAGDHAAIIEAVKNNRGQESIYYLELQNKDEIGWNKLTQLKLKYRFSLKYREEEYKMEEYLINVEEIESNKYLPEILKYINTYEEN